MPNKIKYGLKNVYYSVIADTEGTITYGAPARLPGGVNLTLDPRGERSEFFADDSLYFTAETNQGYEGSLEIALVPDAFRKDVLGYKEDANQALFEDANVLPKPIALMFEFSGDANATRHVMYNVTVSRPNVSGATKTANIEVQTESFDITAAPASDTGYVKAKVEAGGTGYDTFFESVYTYVESQV